MGFEIKKNGTLRKYREEPGVGEVTIPQGVTKIGDGAFSDRKSLAGVTIPESAAIIGDNAFEGCTRLSSAAIPEGVTEIGEETFKGCECLVSVAIPGSAAIIGDNAFKGCTGLTTVTLPENLDNLGYLGKGIFDGCANLRNLIILDSVLEKAPKVQLTRYLDIANEHDLTELLDCMERIKQERFPRK